VFEEWLRRFLCCDHRHLRARLYKALADKRVGVQMIINVTGFLKKLTEILSTHHCTPASEMNFDETSIVVKGESLTTQRVIHASKGPANASLTCSSTVASLLTFAVASGSILISVYVLKAKFKEYGQSCVNFVVKPATRITHRSWPGYLCWTDNGFLNAQLFGRVLDLVAEKWEVRNTRASPDTVWRPVLGSYEH